MTSGLSSNNNSSNNNNNRDKTKTGDNDVKDKNYKRSSDNKKDRLNSDVSSLSSTVSGHKRVGSDMNRFFRRENTDFFVPSARHSAIFLENNRSFLNSSSARRGSDIAGLSHQYTNSGKSISKINPDEPVLTDFNSVNSSNNNINQWQPVRPRRERTEGDIVLQRSRLELRENLEARRRDVEMRFSQEAERMRKNNPRPLTEQERQMEQDIGNSSSNLSEVSVRNCEARDFFSFLSFFQIKNFFL